MNTTISCPKTAKPRFSKGKGGYACCASQIASTSTVKYIKILYYGVVLKQTISLDHLASSESFECLIASRNPSLKMMISKPQTLRGERMLQRIVKYQNAKQQ